jgi:ABC-type multidrug transport system ATPase subunit
MAGKLSGGMKQKLALCCALIHEPTVLFLDEPTTGVDAVSRREFWEMLKKLQKNDITIFVSTPYMDEANLCDDIAFIQESHILSVDTPDKIINNYKPELWAIKTNNMYRALQELKQKYGTDHCHPFGEYHHLSLESGITESHQIYQYLVEQNHQNIKLETIRPTIEDCFLLQMQQKIDASVK